MKITKRSALSLTYLLLVTIFFLYNAWNDTTNVSNYIITLVVIGIIIILSQKKNLLNANNLFLAYYTYVLALGPIFLLAEHLYLNYNYYVYILGGLLCFAWGTLIASNRKKRIAVQPVDKSPIRFNIQRATVLRILWAISIMAGLLYAFKNRALLFGGDIQNGRVSAMAGNGLLIQLAQMSIVTIPMMYEIYYDGPRIYQKKYFSSIEMLITASLSFFVLLLQGYRSYAMTVGLCMAIVMIGKRKISNRKVIFYGILGIFLLEGLGLVRNSMSSSTQNMASFVASLRASLVVNSSNLGYVLETFPQKTPFQYGYTYIMNYLILKPGPDLDFTLWLKEQVGIAFAGGGRTPSILGESYLNFGTWFIFVSMFLLGLSGVAISNYNTKHNHSFWGAYLMWQFAHCASGGLSNIVLQLTLNGIIYSFIKMFPIVKGDCRGKAITESSYGKVNNYGRQYKCSCK